MKYRCSYNIGDGRKRDAGIWEKKETPRTITFTLIEESFFRQNYRIIRINKFYSAKQVRKDGNYNAFRDVGSYISWMNNGHVLRDWKDGTYTAYPNQSGIPYFFEPIEKGKYPAPCKCCGASYTGSCDWSDEEYCGWCKDREDCECQKPRDPQIEQG